MKKVLVTGATGYIASQLLPAFRERYELTLIDLRRERRDGGVVEDVAIVDLSNPNLEGYRKYFRGVDVVVHCAYHRPSQPGVLRYYDERVNLDLAHNVYRVSFDEGVERVVVASSNHAADWYENLLRTKRMDLVYPDTDPYSDNYYGWAKICIEKEGFIFASGALGRKMGVVQIRIGAPREIRAEQFVNDPVGYARDLAAYISQRDMEQLFYKSIEAPNIENEYGIPFQIFYGTSDNARKIWSIANARKTIIYQPQDDSEIRYKKDIIKIMKEGNNI